MTINPLDGGEVFEELATLIRKERDKEKADLVFRGYRKGSINWAIHNARIEGMTKILALVDPEPHK